MEPEDALKELPPAAAAVGLSLLYSAVIVGAVATGLSLICSAVRF